MSKIIPVDITKYSFEILRNLSVQTRTQKPGSSEGIDGMTVGIVMMVGDAPHGGILFAISDKLMVTADSQPGEDVILDPGHACIVPKGECLIFHYT